MIEGFAYFPAIVYRDERSEWVKIIKENIQKYFNQEKNNIFCQTSHISNDPNLTFLSEYLIATSYDILSSQGYLMSQYDLFLSGFWGQELKKFAGTNVHLHKNSQICGWFFLETPEKGSYPIYHDTRANKQMVELDFVQGLEITNATSYIHFNNVVPGTVLFANSWMNHQLTTNMSDSPTKVVHFIVSHKDKLCTP